MSRLHLKSIFLVLTTLLTAVILWHNSKKEMVLGSGPTCTENGTGTVCRGSESTSSTDLCSDPPRGQCGFYRNCLESRFHCGAKGYPLGYGEKYCEKFAAAQDNFSPAGQKWMLDTMQCLQRVLISDAVSHTPEDITVSTDRRCNELKEKAFASHSTCYIENGLCTLTVRDWIHIVKVIGLETLFDSWDAVKETLEAAEGCLEALEHAVHAFTQ